MNILISLMMIAMVAVMLSMAKSSGERICEVLNETSSLTDKKDPVMSVENGEITLSLIHIFGGPDRSVVCQQGVYRPVKRIETAPGISHSGRSLLTDRRQGRC